MRLDSMTQLEVAKAFLGLGDSDACTNCLVYKSYGDTKYCECRKSADCDQILYEFLTEDEDMKDVKMLADKIGIHKLYSLVYELRGE